MTLRAFARCADVRFLADTENPTRIVAQEKCQPPHEDRHFWHSAGYVLLSELRQAAKWNLNVRWAHAPSCWLLDGHDFNCDGAFVVKLLVALDASLEAGMPVQRKLRNLDGAADCR